MSSAPGIPRLVLRYWAAIGFFLVPISIAHTAVLLPAVAGTALFAPGSSRYVLLAAISWIVVYTAMTIALFRVSDVKSIQTFFEGLTIEQQRSIAVFVIVYVNATVGIAAATGTIVAVGTPILGIVVAVVYPFVELRFAVTRQTPAKLVVEGAIALAHVFGAARNVTVDGFVEQFLGGRNPGAESTMSA